MGRFNAVIDCRTEHDSYFADPDDCRMFYHCSDWAGLEHKSCGALFFHPQKKVCDWPRIVRRYVSAELREYCTKPKQRLVLPFAGTGNQINRILIHEE